MLTSNAEATLITSNWLKNSCHCVSLAHHHPGLQAEHQSSIWLWHNLRWCISTQQLQQVLKIPCAFSCMCSPCGIHTSAPPSLLNRRHLNQVQGSVVMCRGNHEFPFFNISAEIHDHYQNHPEIQRITWKLSYILDKASRIFFIISATDVGTASN